MEGQDPKNVRNLTTLGHVDHGKTTLMDALLAANNIISPRMAGKMRYLDSRQDEQERGITMESSAISLKFQVVERSIDGATVPRIYVVNMIDTPGHVDFSSEVSTASRLCDGALILVDVVEGVCTQTIAVLRQAWHDRLRPILIINKFDRLITELRLSPIEAYHHLVRLIEQVNAVMGSFFAGERMDDDLRWREGHERRLEEKRARRADNPDHKEDAGTTCGSDDTGDGEIDENEEFLEKDDEDIYFAPEKGNVVFASALDGWGFRVGKFAKLFSAKLGIKEANLRKVLWGDYFIDPKTKKVISYKHLRGRSLKPLFVQFVLENIWAVYDVVVINPDPDKVVKIVSALNLNIPQRDLKSKDTRTLLQLIFTQWLPLSTCIIQAAIDIVPPPAIAQATRMPKMLHPELRSDAVAVPSNKLEHDLYTSRSDEDACIAAYVSKMFSVRAGDLPENQRRKVTAEDMRARRRAERDAAADADAVTSTMPAPISDVSPSATQKEMPLDKDAEVVLGFARLYSGTLHVGSRVYAVLPKYDTACEAGDKRNARYLLSVTVEGLYTMMGREFVQVESVRAGFIFAIKGLEGRVWRSATLCAQNSAGIGEDEATLAQECLVNLGAVNLAAPPILRVALEPKLPADMPKLISGLKLLSQSDPCVQTFQQVTGEHVILTAGELHFERCLKDLTERFSRIEIQASKPIVPYRETAVKAPDMAPNKTPNFPRGTILGGTANNVVKFTIRAAPLPNPILDFVLQNLVTLKKLQIEHRDLSKEEEEEEEEEEDVYGDIIRKPNVKPEQFWDALNVTCREVGGEWGSIVDNIWAFGPQRAGGCLLIDARKSRVPMSMRRKLDGTLGEKNGVNTDVHNFDNNIETGFQLAMFQGPLCGEPVEGMAYFVESVEIDDESLKKDILQNRLSQITGSVISSVRAACRNGLLDWSPRLMLAMYSCDIQAATDVLGKVYWVIAKRRGRVVAEEMKEGTSFFNISALLPVVKSFGFADDIRHKTSGAATPQLIFSGYELLDQDPFWVPKTEEELEDLGEKSDRSNIAKEYVDSVRERKGMFVDRKIVEFAEKQRTLKR